MKFFKYFFTMFFLICCQTKNDSVSNDFQKYIDINLINSNYYKGTSEISDFLLLKHINNNDLQIEIYTDNLKRGEIIYEKKDNYYYHFDLKDEGSFIKEYSFSIYRENKKLTFNFIKKGNSKKVNLLSYSVLYDIDMNIQKEDFFETDETIVYDNIDFLFNESLLKDSNFLLSISSEYRFDFEKNTCLKTQIDNETKKIISSNLFQIYNSKNAFSPYFKYWKKIN